MSPVGRSSLSWPKRLIPGDGATGDQGSQNRPTPELRRWRWRYSYNLAVFDFATRHTRSYRGQHTYLRDEESPVHIDADYELRAARQNASSSGRISAGSGWPWTALILPTVSRQPLRWAAYRAPDTSRTATSGSGQRWTCRIAQLRWSRVQCNGGRLAAEALCGRAVQRRPGTIRAYFSHSENSEAILAIVPELTPA